MPPIRDDQTDHFDERSTSHMMNAGTDGGGKSIIDSPNLLHSHVQSTHPSSLPQLSSSTVTATSPIDHIYSPAQQQQQTPLTKAELRKVCLFAFPDFFLNGFCFSSV